VPISTLRKQAAIFNETCPKIASREGGVEADRQIPGVATTYGLGAINDNLQFNENPPSTVDKAPACRRRPHAAIRALEQGNPELLLQLSDPSA
jgi:hypothetical protein